MQLTRNYKILIVTITIVTAFAAGRYSTTSKVIIETKTVEVEKKTDDKTIADTKKKTKKYVRQVVTKPDGTKTDTTTITDNDTDDKKTTDVLVDNTQKTDNTYKETVKGDQKVTVSALIGIDLHTGKPLYGASVYKPILGPIGAGAWGTTDGVNGSVGGSVGLSF